MTPPSERIARFISETGSDPTAALASLERDLEASRGPLVEKIPDSSDVLVTFVFIGAVESVRVFCELWPHDLSRVMLGPSMTRVPGTGVWYASVRADPRISVPYQFQIDPPSFGSTIEEAHALLADRDRLASTMRGLFEAGRPDRYNPERSYPLAGIMGADPDGSASEDRWESVLTLPAADPFPYLGKNPLRGRLERHAFDSAGLPGRRDVTVYLPPAYAPATRYPVVILLDGEMALRCGRLAHVIDEAIALGAIPPLVCVFWHNLTIASRMTEMACNPALPDVLADELLPWVRNSYSVTDDPARVVVGGMSFGGLASAWVPFRRSDRIGAAFIGSPSFWFSPLPPEEAAKAPEWLIRQYQAHDTLPIRMYVAVGSLESSVIPVPGANGKSMVDLARTFREVAARKGYQVVGYREEPGGHNFVTVRRLIVPALAALLGGRASEGAERAPMVAGSERSR
jgi:enterochelin esterase family protein